MAPVPRDVPWPKDGHRTADNRNDPRSHQDQDGTGAVAIVGFSFTFPQDVTSSVSFWDLLMESRNTVTKFPQDRLSADALYHPDRNRRGQVSQ